MKNKIFERGLMILIIGLMIGTNVLLTGTSSDDSQTELSVMTWNVGDVPEISPTSGAAVWQITDVVESLHPQIIGFQEDFRRNLFDSVWGRDLYRISISATTAPLGWVLGNGLTAFSDYPKGFVEKVSWDACHGVVTDNNDCLAAKGFTYIQLFPSPLEHRNFPIHFYNLHLDADEGAGDEGARSQQLVQLRQFMDNNSAGKAVIIVGDFNMHGDNAYDMFVLDNFINDQGLHMSCPENQHTHQGGEKFDYIFYRSSANVQLQLQGCRVCYQEGEFLSDHYPVKADFLAAIHHGPLPDIVVTDVWLEDSNYIELPNAVYATVKNIGAVPTAAGSGITTFIWVGDVQAGYFTVLDSGGNLKTLDVDESYTGKLIFSDEMRAEILSRYGSDNMWVVEAKGDANNVIPELNRTNNNLQKTLPSIRFNLESPLGGAGVEYAAGDNLNIEWTYSGLGGNVNIWLLKDGETDCLLDATSVWDRLYTWTVSDCGHGSGGNYKIKVSTEDGSYSDTSADFSIVSGSEPTITITSPNGDEDWEIGGTYAITWDSTDVVGKVKIELLQGSTTLGDIVTSTTNDGRFNWTIGSLLDITPGSNYKVEITSNDDPAVWDISDGNFEILQQPAVTVTSPNGGENWEEGSTHAITWTSTVSVGNVKIEYSTDNGNSWINIIGSTTNDGSYDWTVPNSLSSTCFVRISEAADGDPSDGSNGVFSITQKTVPPAMTSPIPGSTLPGSTVTFKWTSGTGIERYAIDVGTSKGAFDIYDEYSHTELFRTVTNIPIDASTIWVRLCYRINGAWSHIDYSYTALAPIPPKMTSPTPGSTLAGSTVTFKWTAGTGIDRYALDVGTSKGAFDIYDENSHTNLSRTVNNLPTDGSTVWVRLVYKYSGQWGHIDYSYTAYTTAPPKIKSPAPGSTLPGSTVTFKWTSGIGVERYAIDVGTSKGAFDIYDEYSHTNLSRTVTNIPIDGSTIWVRLCYRIAGKWYHIDYSYKALTPVPPIMTSPAPGSTLAGSTVTFKWTAGKGVERYAIDVGSSKGASDIYDEYSHTNLSRTVTNIPTDGRTIWVRLCYRINGAWSNVSYSYKASQ